MHRLRIAGLLAATLVLATPTVGLAWANGSPVDAYGTHDWILDQALTLAGVSWVDTSTALLASDDPDNTLPSQIDVPNHVFHVTGDRGAPSTVAAYYHLTQQAYQQADYAEASRLLGVVSHYFADINVPFHTGPTADDLMTHLFYEFAVDDRLDAPGKNAWYLTPVARRPLTDVRARTVEAAYASRAYYASLIAEYEASNYNSTVESITAVCVSRAVNDLADIIQAVETGAGLASAGHVSLDTASRYVAQDSQVLVTANCTDDAGDPVEGARVVFVWPLPGGTVTHEVITDAAGVVRSRVDVGDAPLGVELAVTGTVTSGADSATGTAIIVPTPVVGSMRTVVPCARPAPGTLLTASTLLLDDAGAPMEGVDVRFTWTQGATSIEHTVTTGPWGMARSYQVVAFDVGDPVSVTTTAHSAGGPVSSSASFRPTAAGGSQLNALTVAGSDRFSTAAAVSRAAYPDGADTVLIATGLNWPDALGGAALAGAFDGPILLTGPTALPSVIAAEVARLGADRAFILGGTRAVSGDVEDDLRSAGVTTVRRISGLSRYSTARDIADATIDAQGSAYDGFAFVTTGGNFPDALAASSIAAFRKWPIYLADPSGSPAWLTAHMYADGVRDVIILGGQGAVSSQYEAAFRSAFDTVTRLGGTDRYATGVLIAEYGSDSCGLAWDGLPVATGSNFPDALAGGVIAARLRSVMLLTDGRTLPTPVRAALRAHEADVGTVHYLGGTNSISPGVRDAIEGSLD